MNILLNYVFPITSIEPTAAVSTGFLKQALAVVKPKAEDDPTGVITQCVSKTQIATLTANPEPAALIDAGMSRVFVTAVDDLTELGAVLEGHDSDFFTVLITSDFTDGEIDAMDLGAFKGVVATASADDAKNKTRTAQPDHCAMHTDATVKAKNLFHAFGKMLSNALGWGNQQFIPMPYLDDVNTLGKANALFDDKISFVLNDSQYGKRLALFAAGGKAIVAPYIKRNLELDIQSKALQYISANQPDYTPTQATLLEDELQKVVDSYISRRWISAGKIEIKLEQENFVASGYINIAEPKALWRIYGEMRQTI